MLPLKTQARKAIWTAVNPHTGKRRVDEAFPLALRDNTVDDEMFIRFKNGATWQVVGSDQYNSLVGAGVAGVTFSEFALANPAAWGYIRPMLEENDGWATFITTPRGRNHALSMYQMAKDNPRWFAEVSNIHSTGALSPEQISESLAEYVAMYGEDIGRAQFEQEYECSFNAAILGAFYAREMISVRAEGRIDDIEALPRAVHRAWDIGVRDDTSIWWFQVVGGQVYILDCYTANGVGVDHYASVIEQRRKDHGWIDGTDFVPHDAKVKEWGTGRTRVETMQGLGLHPQVVPMAGLLDGINAARQTLPRCVFHPRCEEVGISALEQYRREWDDDNKVFKQNPLHDWCFTSETAIVTRHGMCQIGSLPISGEVLTPCGWKPYINPRVTRRAARLVEVRFKDGLSVKCTPDHMFKTVSGWKSAESLDRGSKIQSSWTASRSISWVASIACGRMKGIYRRAAASFTETFGPMLSGKSQEDAIFTTETPTPSTMTWKIWNAYLPVITWGRHGRQEKHVGISDHSQMRLAQRHPNGTSQTRGANGIDATRSILKAGRNGSVSRAHALTAGLSSLALSARTAISRSFAALTAKPRIIECVLPLNETADVWCITVPGVEAFALSNGATVHNCSHVSDAFRYLALAWRQIAPVRQLHEKPKYAISSDGYVTAPDLPGMRTRR